MMDARKISFQEAWDSAAVFFLSDELETDVRAVVDSLLSVANHPSVAKGAIIDVSGVCKFLADERNALDVILKDIGLPSERFQRIVTLLRKLGRIPGGLDVEWHIERIKRKAHQEPEFRQLIAELVVDGSMDDMLAKHIPRYYLDTLDYRAFQGSTQEARRVRYESVLAGTRCGRMGYVVEARIGDRLSDIEERYGIGYGSGRWDVAETNIDLAVPTPQDPWVIIMSSFQETTSSGQTNKIRDMHALYDRIRHFNSRNRQDRAFVHFVDGGGWLARKADFERAVDQCDYFLNFAHLDMLEAIVLKHVPTQFRTK